MPKSSNEGAHNPINIERSSFFISFIVSDAAIDPNATHNQASDGIFAVCSSMASATFPSSLSGFTLSNFDFTSLVVVSIKLNFRFSHDNNGTRDCINMFISCCKRKNQQIGDVLNVNLLSNDVSSC